MSDTALVLLARYPEAGQGKTRLAQTLGKVETMRIYTSFLRDLATRFVDSPYDLHWAYTPQYCDFLTFAATLLPAPRAVSWQAFAQQGPDLGARLQYAFRTMAAHQYKRTILIGSDTPHISRAVLVQAKQALDSADVVLGPAEDGGYYLIAMQRPYDVFSAIPMSTELVLEMTIAKARQQHLKVTLLETLFDIDTQTDLLRLQQMLQENRELAPHTAACLDALTERGLLV
ncbi:TIGR04282 family arsenosugar biosynthesis glycosyltransferase [Dictyobacter arantiisoli]|uniref:Glycosyl transferase n=1 Tax=Dictyobacter arantiisoli TaxID=2014874 RepID=A0A5A5TFS1_9CHLR|nr:TIGR04282 family arsenosugar biosynthesis glycosyltransferase [Dictyobacter arantiisoli]GCF10262.1 hypothetical protein KDI_38260 [Dictyobacter arantiisoli]